MIAKWPFQQIPETYIYRHKDNRNIDPITVLILDESHLHVRSLFCYHLICPAREREERSSAVE